MNQLLPISKSYANDFFNPFFETILAPHTNLLLKDFKETYPKVNLIEKKDSFEIIAAIPGFKKEDLNVTYEDGVLSIEGKYQKEEIKNENYLYKELIKSNFSRSFKFDDKDIDTKNIRTSYDAGELKLQISKKEKKSIQIKIN